MIVTLDDLVEYSKGIDARLAALDVDKLKDKIRYGVNKGSESFHNYGSIDDLFKCRPSLLYPILVNQWSGTVNDDKLLIGSVNTCVAVRPFSTYVLPYSK